MISVDKIISLYIQKYRFAHYENKTSTMKNGSFKGNYGGHIGCPPPRASLSP